MPYLYSEARRGARAEDFAFVPCFGVTAFAVAPSERYRRQIRQLGGGHEPSGEAHDPVAGRRGQVQCRHRDGDTALVIS